MDTNELIAENERLRAWIEYMLEKLVNTGDVKWIIGCMEKALDGDMPYPLHED